MRGNTSLFHPPIYGARAVLAPRHVRKLRAPAEESTPKLAFMSHGTKFISPHTLQETVWTAKHIVNDAPHDRAHSKSYAQVFHNVHTEPTMMNQKPT